ncbi:MAG: AMP-binding protein [Acidimicrobiales bacterium]
MHPCHHALATPAKAAHVMAPTGEPVSYAELDRRSNQLAHLLRQRGLQPGDVVAILMENNARYFEAVWAADRSGLYYTCVSTRLTPAEAAHIVNDSGAAALLTSVGVAPLAVALVALTPAVHTRLVAGGPLAGHEPWDQALATQPAGPLTDQTAGADLLYSSGTTGRPKGVKPPLAGKPIDAVTPALSLGRLLYGFGPDMVYLSPAPLYHAAPLRFSRAVQQAGGTLVIMEQFDAVEFLAAIERHRVTHTQVVPTMFVRLLRLPEAERSRHDLSSLACCIHAAAPCPVPVKEQMIDWWGPIVHEYYAGTESNGLCAISPAEWLERKGSVGTALLGTVRITDDSGHELPAGEVGTVWFEGGADFEYHNDPEATKASRNDRGWTTMGDVGYLDADGYLFLTDRRVDVIISGGVNIYPREAEGVLSVHPKVVDAAVFGVPDDDFGESVKAAVQLVDPAEASPELAGELVAFCRARLAHHKCPRSIDFEAELPRHPTGKLLKRLLRDRYWQGRASRIV